MKLEKPRLSEENFISQSISELVSLVKVSKYQIQQKQQKKKIVKKICTVSVQEKNKRKNVLVKKN